MTSYKFERENPPFGTDSDVDNDLDVFTKRLQQDSTSPLELIAGDKELLRTYVIANHRAVVWYIKKRYKKRKLRNRYALGRILLLFLLPIGVFALSFLWEGQAGVTQATVLLTGFMAAFRTSSGWMETEFAASNFENAVSKLKEKIYAFECEWKGKAFNKETLTSECKNALKEGITQAREIVRNQREAYFTASAPPSIDIMKSLDKARTDVAALIKNYQSPELTKALKDEQDEKAAQLTKNLLLGEISKLTALINARDQLISEKERELAAGPNTDRKGALKTFIATLRKAQEETETTLINKTSELAAL